MDYSIQPPPLKSRSRTAIFRNPESAHSSVLGVLMLIAIVMIMGGVVAVIFTTQSMPDKVPMAYLGIAKSNDGVELINKAGESLTSSSVIIVVDGIDRTSEFRTQENTPGWGTLEVGDHLYYKSAVKPESVQIIYAGSSGQYLLASTEATINAPTRIVSASIMQAQPTRTVSVSVVDALVLSTTIPASMIPGQSYPVSVTMKNTGSMTWEEGSMIRLGGVGDLSGVAAKFGPARICIPKGTSVPSGAQYTFNFTMTAPARGSYVPQYKMVWEGHQWFGAQASQSIQVTGKAMVDAQILSTTLPSTMSPGQKYPVSVTLENTGSMTWEEGNMIRLGGVGDSSGVAAKFGPARICIPKGTSVPSGSHYTFNFIITAPATQTILSPQYKMVWEGRQWFGGVAARPIVVVNPENLPHAQFTASATQGKSPLSVQFTDQSTGAGPFTYHWDFSDGEGNLPENSQQNPAWRFWQDGGTSYTVTLTVTNAYGTDTIVRQNYITLDTREPAAPVAEFTSSVQTGIAPLAVQFTDLSVGDPVTYAWDVDNDRNTDYITKSPSHTYSNAGNYTITLTVSNAAGSDTEIKTWYITVSSAGIIPTPTPTTVPQGAAPKAQFMSNITQGGSPLVVQFTDQSTGAPPMTYHWDFADGGGNLPENSQQNPVWRFWGNTGTSFTTTLTVTNAYGSDTIVKKNLIILGASQPPVTPTPTPAPTIVPTKIPAAQFIANSTQGKNPLAVQFTDKTDSTGSTSYQWDINNDGVVDYSTKNPVHTYKTAGTFTVKLTVTNASGRDSEIKTGYITTTSSTVQTGDCYGAEVCNPTGNPLGGGAGYTRIITGTDSRVKYTVSTRSELISALKTAKSGEVVFVKGTAVIDMAGTPNTVIPAGVIVASDRGNGGSQGALIKYSSNSNGQYLTSMFVVGGNNVRITGLRLQGESLPQDGTGNGEASFLTAIKEQNKAGLEVDNCEIWGWAWAGVLAMDSTGSFIHHNYIHNNQARGEGYGAEVCGGDMLIEANIFNYNRHDISASGRPGERYEARYNLVRGDGHPIGSHHFDVHACNPNNYNDDSETSSAFIAGDLYKIHHNTFEAGWQAPIGIRSRPVNGAYIYNNIFMSDSIDTAGGVPVWQRANTFGNMFVTNNYWKGTLYTGDKIVWYYHP